MQQVVESFAGFLAERFAAGIATTEDSVRYTFFYALTAGGYCSHLDIELERPHTTIPGAKIDTFVSGAQSRAAAAVEFKYDRTNPGGSNQNRTQRAGALLNDLFRLAQVPAKEAPARYFVYLTDREMAAYLSNPANGLHRLFDLARGERLILGSQQVQQLARSARERVRDARGTIVVVGFLSCDLPGDVSLCAYSVE